jgi:hypothetical protein
MNGECNWQCDLNAIFKNSCIILHTITVDLHVEVQRSQLTDLFVQIASASLPRFDIISARPLRQTTRILLVIYSGKRPSAFENGANMCHLPSAACSCGLR